MALLLDDIRAEFARFLSADPAARFRMDAALAHVITIAYRQGLNDGIRAGIDLGKLDLKDSLQDGGRY